MEQESRRLEFKQDRTKTYLKTVSAFANYDGGEIRFGVKDDGSLMPIEDSHAFALDLENQINDSISPQVCYKIALNSNNTVSLYVEKGLKTPYFYDGKAYKRNNTSTVEVDEIELKRLIIEGENLSFDALPSNDKELTFSTLDRFLKKALDLKEVNDYIYKTIGLIGKDGFNNAALLFSDQNKFSGLDIAVFGENINIFKERHNLSNYSILDQYEKAIEIFRRNYVEERIESSGRNKFERIPEIAFREILVNAILHRCYDVNINTKVEMYDDRIIITSPGGLPSGISHEQFENGFFSVLRNPKIVAVFYRLELAESFAKGIVRTNFSYFPFDNKPRFESFDNCVRVTLPTVEDKFFLTIEEDEFLSLIDSNVLYTREKLEYITGYNKSKLIRILNALIKKKYIRKIGKGKSTYYSK